MKILKNKKIPKASKEDLMAIMVIESTLPRPKKTQMLRKVYAR